jgi:hypothetical protein
MAEDQLRSGVKVVGLTVVGIVLMLIVLFNLGGHGSPDTTPAQTAPVAPKATYTATWMFTDVVNPASVNVTFLIQNTSTVAGKPSCTVNVSDASGAYSGFNQGDWAQMAAKGIIKAQLPVVVTHEGAVYVTDTKVTCK